MRTALRPLTAALALVLLLAGCSAGDRDDPTAGSRDLPAAEAAADAADTAADDADLSRPLPDPAGEGAGATGAASGLSEPLPPLDAPLPETAPPVGINPWVATADDDRSTFGFDVDTISYTRVREAVEQGGAIPPDEVRVEELVNAFDYGYATDPDETFTITADGATPPWARGDDAHRLLRIGVASPVPDERQPTDLVFVIDTSGSMAPHLPLVQDSLRVLVDNLAADDAIAILEYGDDARPLLDPTPVADRERILGVIDDLATGGSTNLESGLVAGYRTAEEMAAPGRSARVVLLSDGIANVGLTDPDGILARVEDAGERGIHLLTVGYGLTGFNDPLMEQLADRGDGFAVYVDRIEQAEEVFGEQLTTTLQAIATDARSQVAFNPEAVESYRLIGYENRAIADDDFRDDTVEAGQIGAGHTVTALYALRLADRPVGPVGTVSVRWLDPETRDPAEIAHVVDVDDVTGDWEGAVAGLRLAGAVAAWGELLRGSPHVDGLDVAVLAGEAERIAAAVDDDRIAEWAQLVARTTG